MMQHGDDAVIVDIGMKEARDLQVGDWILAWNPRQRVINTTRKQLSLNQRKGIEHRHTEKPYLDTQLQERLVKQSEIASQ
jgi:hypothetical protein